MVPAVEQSGRHHVERLKILVNRSEDLLKVRQNRASELVNQERAVGIENGVRCPQNGASRLRGHSRVRYTRQDVIGPAQLEPRQHGIGIGGRAVYHVQPVVPQPALEKPHEVGIGLQRDQNRVGPHASENFPSERTYPRPILEENPGTLPVDLGENVIDEETGARDQAAEHFRMFQEISPKEQDLLGAGGTRL